MQILIILAVVAAFVYPAVRFSVAPAMTFADGRISLFRALPLSRGRFWSMLGAYALALVLMLVVGLLAMVIFTFAVGAVGMAQGGANALPALFGMMKSSDMSMTALFSPLRLANLIFGSLLGTLAYLIMFAPAAAIFRELTGRVGAPVHAPKPASPGADALDSGGGARSRADPGVPGLQVLRALRHRQPGEAGEIDRGQQADIRHRIARAGTYSRSCSWRSNQVIDPATFSRLDSPKSLELVKRLAV